MLALKEGGEIDLAILCALGQLGINLGEPPRGVKQRGERRYLSFSEKALETELRDVVTSIEQALQGLGGPTRPT